ncbi:hypothetical protein IQ264_01370 [Phormidium sp. LEGE 05292]|uniref:hypothetical protein n=1 Tax=[Phormidium] sp. LEGE 05292 TaxID=767427 RepID=UPI0018815AD9|nr:hypothetical protein [Phormidium sp. LEGE 05292]MBE9224123.1 hypothetical protein [Phormidium sp. LEGE 05292]
MMELRKYQIPLSGGDCFEYLQFLQLQATLLHLYQELFPTQWNNSTTGLFQKSCSVVYTDRELEFLKLLNSWFPIEYYDDLEAIEERYEEIPIYPQNFSWWNEDFEQLNPVEQFIISLLGWGYDLEEWESVFGFTPTHITPPEQIDWEKLEQLSLANEAPLQYLYNVVSIIDRSSDCIWIDITDECWESLPWTKENILYLKNQWELAVELSQQMAAFSEWLTVNVEHRYKAFNLWNQAQKSSSHCPH